MLPGTGVGAGTTTDANTKNTDSDIGGTSASSSTKLHCSKCSRPYKRAVFLAKHEERCDGRKIRKESTISIQTSGTVSYEHSILFSFFFHKIPATVRVVGHKRKIGLFTIKLNLVNFDTIKGNCRLQVLQHDRQVWLQ